MKVGLFLTARLGSSRLKQKHLLPVGDTTLLGVLMARIEAAFERELADGTAVLAITTSDEEENREFERHVGPRGRVFYGSVGNIPLRHLQAARALQVDAIVSIDGDDILCSVDAMRHVFEALLKGAPLARTADLPFGMNAWGYSTAVLAEVLERDSSDLLETGWGRIFAGIDAVEARLPRYSSNDLLRFTLDYDGDYQFFKAVIEGMGAQIVTATDREIVDFVQAQGLGRLNENLAKEYWANFHQKVQEEQAPRAPN